MKHTIEIYENDNLVVGYEDLSKKEAITVARKESTDKNQVFILAYNGQCTVYLNPDGNYDITGKSW
jgi:hypothetical protein